MIKRMLIDSTQDEETRVVVINGNKLEEAEFETSHRKQIKGNIYLAKVMRVEPSLQACFVDYGGNKHGFLAFGEIHPDYYNLPQEQIDAIDKEVNEIIEAKKQALKEREAERERIRAEKAAAYARKLAEQAKAEAEAQAMAQEGESENIENKSDDIVQENPLADETQPSLEAKAQNESIEAQNIEEAVEPVSENDANIKAEEEKSVEAENTQEAENNAEQASAEKTEKKTRRKKTPAQKLEEAEEKITDEEIAAEVEEAGKKHPLKKRAAKKRIRKKKEELKVLAEESDLGEEKVSQDINSDETDDNTAENESESAYYAKEPQSSFASDDNDDLDNDQDDEDDEQEVDFELQRKLLRARKLYHNSKIQDVIKEGQILLIQVVKEERGNKGAALTTYLSLAGRYCVLMPNRIKSGGVSRKITNVADRKRLKAIVKELPLTTDMSLIVRTAGEEKTKADIVRDYNYLIRSWNLIRLSALKNKAPCMIHEEGNLIKRALRDIYTKDISEVLVAGEEGYKVAKNFVRILSPHSVKKIKFYRNDDMPLFQRFQVEGQLDKLHEATAQLESGGYLVINPTEALVSIDVNSGRATKEKDLEETALKTNLEACDEIARQLRLRNLAGLVVVDFIDMEDPANNHAVEKRMKEALKKDRSRIQIAKMSCFGLLEISRQRMHSSFMESNYQVCPYCQGQGMVRTLESSTIFVLRGIEEEGIRNRSSQINVFVPDNIAIHLLNHKRQTLLDLEQKYKMNIIISADNTIKNINDYRIEKVKAVQTQEENVKEENNNNFDIDEEYIDEQNQEEFDDVNASEANEEKYQRKDNRRRRDRRDRRNRRGRDRRRNNQDFDDNKNQASSDAQNSNEPVILYDSHNNAPEEKSDEAEKKTKKTAWWKKLIKS